MSSKSNKILETLRKLPVPDYLELTDEERTRWEDPAAPENKEERDNNLIICLLKGFASNDEDTIDKALDFFDNYHLSLDKYMTLFSRGMKHFIKILTHNEYLQNQALLSHYRNYFRSPVYFMYNVMDDATELFRNSIIENLDEFVSLNSKPFFKYIIVYMVSVILTRDAVKKLEILAPFLDEDDLRQKGNVLLGLGFTRDKNNQNIRFLLESYLDHEDDFLKYCAALSLFEINTTKVDRKVIDILLESMKSPEYINKQFEVAYIWKENFDYHRGYHSFYYYGENLFDKNIDGDMFFSSMYKGPGESPYESLVEYIIQKIHSSKFFNISHEDKKMLTNEMLYIMFGADGFKGTLSEKQTSLLKYLKSNQETNLPLEEIAEILSGYGLSKDLSEI